MFDDYWCNNLILNYRLSQRRPCLLVNAQCLRWLPLVWPALLLWWNVEYIVCHLDTDIEVLYLRPLMFFELSWVALACKAAIPNEIRYSYNLIQDERTWLRSMVLLGGWVNCGLYCLSHPHFTRGHYLGLIANAAFVKYRHAGSMSIVTRNHTKLNTHRSASCLWSFLRWKQGLR